MATLQILPCTSHDFSFNTVIPHLPDLSTWHSAVPGVRQSGPPSCVLRAAPAPAMPNPPSGSPRGIPVCPTAASLPLLPDLAVEDQSLKGGTRLLSRPLPESVP